jgi:hypothetical protein
MIPPYDTFRHRVGLVPKCREENFVYGWRCPVALHFPFLSPNVTSHSIAIMNSKLVFLSSCHLTTQQCKSHHSNICSLLGICLARGVSFRRIFEARTSLERLVQ